jgi:hypothetical protein
MSRRDLLIAVIIVVAIIVSFLLLWGTSSDVSG